jgi:predicted phosphodiesterase
MSKDKYKYNDDNNNVHFIAKDGLDKAVKYKIELQKSNGKANWNVICKWLRKDGYDAKRCEAFRTLVRRYQGSKGLLPKNKVYTSVKNNSNALDNALGEYALTVREAQNSTREYNKLKRKFLDKRLVDKEVLNTINKALGNAKFHIKQDKTIVPCETENNDLAMVIAISDWHIGSMFKGADYSFNYAILKKCVKEYLQAIKERITLKSPSKIYVVSLGDLIENLYMRNQDQAFEAEFDLATQQTKAIELLSWFLTQICSYTNAKVYYTGIAGNHDRSNGNYRNNIYGDSFNKVLGAVVNLLSKSVTNLNYIESDSTYRTHLSINGTNIKAIHGDIDNIHSNDIIASLGQRDNRLYSVLLLGHEHHYEVKEQNGLFFMIGSLKGSDSFSDKLGLHAGRSQGILWVDKAGNAVPDIVKLYTK